ncbi:MAG: epoxyqueuosine reductase QueH [Candidatus Omnitrophica bacterium]|nr:epoxyqueuosine reductase QueH [Candidatus Omnitrophota bacterium]
MKTLLHICCGVCAAGVASTLKEEGHDVTGFFYNPNIYPLDEYQKRLEACRNIAKNLKFDLIEGDQDFKFFGIELEKFKSAPEGAERCELCYRLRLKKTFDVMKELGYDNFATTLTISPYKKAEVVNIIGKSIGGNIFLARDFKKNDGFKKTIELAKKYNLYRQNYCGCEWSQR